MGKEVKPVNICTGLLLGKCRLGLGVDPGDQQLEPGVSLSESHQLEDIQDGLCGCCTSCVHHYFELRHKHISCLDRIQFILSIYTFKFQESCMFPLAP